MSDVLAGLRGEIDSVDERIVDLLADRFDKTRQVGEYKRQHDLPPMDPARETEVFARLEALALARGISPELVHELFATVMTAVKLEHAELSRR